MTNNLWFQILIIISIFLVICIYLIKMYKNCKYKYSKKEKSNIVEFRGGSNDSDKDSLDQKASLGYLGKAIHQHLDDHAILIASNEKLHKQISQKDAAFAALKQDLDKCKTTST